MQNAIRLGVIVAVVLGASAARADHDPYTENAPHPQEAQAMPATDATAVEQAPAVAATKASNAPKAGAGGMEPAEAVDEDPGQGAHRAWVESIWSSI
jgi:hypothetical protein